VETADLRKRQEADAESSEANMLVKQAELLRKQNEAEKKKNALKTSTANITQFVGVFMDQVASQEAEIYAQQEDEDDTDNKPAVSRRPSLSRQSSVEAPALVRRRSIEAPKLSRKVSAEAAPKLSRRLSSEAPVLVRQSSGSKRKAAQIEEDDEREEESSDIEPDNGMSAHMAMFLQSSQSQDLW
jgi:hypothetical protein